MRQCLALPFIDIRDLQATVDDRKNIDMGEEDTNLSRDEWMTYIQDIWMDGVYNPDTWNIFGHRSD